MDDTKRLILAIALSVIILVGYQVLFVKPPEQAPTDTQPQATEQGQTAARQAPANVSDYTPAPQAQPLPAPAPQQVPVINSRTISVSTPLYNIAISESGAAVTSFELKNYRETNKKDSPLKQLVSEDLRSGTLMIGMKGPSVPGLANAAYRAQTDITRYDLGQGDSTSIEFIFQTAQNVVIKKTFTFSADTYLIDCDVVIQNGSPIALKDDLYISTPGIFNKEVKSRSRLAFEGPIAFINDKYNAIDPDDIEEQDTFKGSIAWSGFTDRYFMTAVVPRNSDGQDAAESGTIELSWVDEVVTSSFVRKIEHLEPGKQGSYGFTIFMGPKSREVLGAYENDLKYAVNFGFFHIIAKPLLDLMNMIHNFIPNFGVAIILLTIIIKLIFWPLGTKSYKSMNAMKKLAPLMTEIREKYKDDKQRMNQEIMGLYKTYKVNPASGCLPLLVQMPIFFALYRMLYQAIELRHAPFFGWITDLSGPERLFNFNFAIPMMQEPYGIPMLTVLMGASFLLQQKMTPTTGDPMQAKMMMLMPIFMTVIFINFPSGLVLYMFVNNIISMGQQFYIQKKFA